MMPISFTTSALFFVFCLFVFRLFFFSSKKVSETMARACS